MMYWVKGTIVNRPLVMCWKGEAFHSLMIRSLSFGESMPLPSSLTVFYSFSLPVGGKGWLELVGVGYLPSPKSVKL